MRRVVLLVLLLITSISLANAATLSVGVSANNGVVCRPSNFTVKLEVKPGVEHIPLNVVLVMDCSPSMSRFSKVIYGPVRVNLTKECGCCCGRWKPIANFTLNETSDVEVLLSYSLEDYYNVSGWGYDRVDVALDNPSGGMCGGCCCKWGRTCTDPAAFLFRNVPAGRHTIYVKLYGRPRVETRYLVVALPPERIEAAKEAAKFFVGLTGTHDRIGVVRVGSVNTTEVLLNLTGDKVAVNRTIDDLTLDSWICLGGGCRRCCCGHGYVRIYELTALGEGLEDAYKMLKACGNDSVKAIILLTDGGWNDGICPLDVAEQCREHDIKVYTVGFGIVNESLLRKIADITGGKYYYATNERVLKKVYSEIYRDVVTYAKNVTLKLSFDNPNVKYVKSTPSGNLTGNVVEWHWNSLKNDTNVTVWVNSTAVGRQIVANGTLTYYDYGGAHTVNFDVVMNFTANLILTVTPSNPSVKEGQTLNITITANYPIENVTYSAVPSITNYNSRVSINVTGNTAVFSWTPFYNYVNNNTIATISFNVTSVYGVSNSTKVNVTVYNVQAPPVVITVRTNRTSVTEGETVNISVSSNYPIGRITFNATPSITANNSRVSLVISGYNATISWTPLPNYVNSDTLVDFNVTAICPPYGSNSTSTQIYVKNLPLTVNLYANRTTVTEGETVGMEVRTNLPIENVTLTGSPSITSSNSIVKIAKINSTSYLIEWTPLYNYVNANTTATVTVSVKDVYGDESSTSRQVDVINAQRKISLTWYSIAGTNMYVVEYRDTRPPKDVGFRVECNGKAIDYDNGSFILTYFRKNYTIWMLEIVPQYNFTNSLNHDVELKVTFYDNNGKPIRGTTITIENTSSAFYPLVNNVGELDNFTISWRNSIGYPKPVFVGELVRINVTFVNSTGYVTVNGEEVGRSTTPNEPIPVAFVPNAAGDYTIQANAFNNTEISLLLWKDVPVRIKPVSP